jgi:cytochrome bd-type quinol oxidase subunit 2
MKQIIKNLLYVILLITIFLIPYFVFADSALDKLKKVGTASGYDPNTNQYTATEIVGNVVSVFFSILGVIFTILILYSGFNWMTAAGESSKVEKAKDTIKRAIIGLIIVFCSFAIWQFIFDNFINK